uniref:Uncharacterized protein n=1 Tax=Anopheles arabiensis TaxID=7173 RepID=A0A182IFI9_ANOAR
MVGGHIKTPLGDAARGCSTPHRIAHIEHRNELEEPRNHYPLGDIRTSYECASVSPAGGQKEPTANRRRRVVQMKRSHPPRGLVKVW